MTTVYDLPVDAPAGAVDGVVVVHHPRGLIGVDPSVLDTTPACTWCGQPRGAHNDAQWFDHERADAGSESTIRRAWAS